MRQAGNARSGRAMVVAGDGGEVGIGADWTAGVDVAAAVAVVLDGVGGSVC